MSKRGGNKYFGVMALWHYGVMADHNATIPTQQMQFTEILVKML